jgi:NADH dehydrogenase
MRTSGRPLVLGRGRNPINFVSTADVAALVERAVVDESLRGEVLEIGGDTNITMLEFAEALQHAAGSPGPPRHVPRALLRAISILALPVNPSFAGQARAAVVMDTTEMTFDPSAVRARFPDLPNTPFARALEGCLPRS